MNPPVKNEHGKDLHNILTLLPNGLLVHNLVLPLWPPWVLTSGIAVVVHSCLGSTHAVCGLQASTRQPGLSAFNH